MVMMGEIRLDDWNGKSEKKNDQDEVDRTILKVYSKGKEMYNVSVYR